jgi:hypothetical protein
MKWQPGKSPLQQLMQKQAQAQRQRNLEGGWWLQQQKANMNELLLGNSLTRRVSLSSRIPLSPSTLRLGSRPLQLVLPSKRQPSLTVKPSATIRKIWQEFNVEHSDQQGMRIHIAFTVANLLRRTGTVAAYFRFANGVPLKDFNDNYGTKTGNVCAAGSFTPMYLNTQYNDFVLFMPYLELHMGPGNHSLKFYVVVWDDQNRELTWSDWVSFTYTST